ncbi:ras-related protein Rab-37 [Frankliniella occidentalis]|uniref:small monomeric GTPase n=1 Tax=Frankliniella occidentalis TaxID=133901 RepID=A0A9C6WY87_FRAOC|nr:ras-related protein Rab-37 [Frankliniella occidentalis]
MDPGGGGGGQQQQVANNINNINNNGVGGGGAASLERSELPSQRALRPAWSMQPHIQRTPSLKRRQQQQQQQQQEQQQRLNAADAAISALAAVPVPPPAPLTASPPRSASSTSSQQQVFFPPSPATAAAAAASPPPLSRTPSRTQSRTPSRAPSRGPSEDYDLVCKVMLLGDSGVGKTCLLVRFQNGYFLSGNFISTVGVDFRNKLVTVDGVKVKLQIWDTAGQERFRSVTHAYYRDAHALLLLYDVTNKASFDNIRAWLGEIREYAQDDVVIMLLGNKADCNERIVRREDGERLAREYNVAFMETSAKTGLNVEVAFMAVARELKSRKSGNPDDNRFNVQDYVREHQTQRPSCPPCST